MVGPATQRGIELGYLYPWISVSPTSNLLISEFTMCTADMYSGDRYTTDIDFGQPRQPSSFSQEYDPHLLHCEIHPFRPESPSRSPILCSEIRTSLISIHFCLRHLLPFQVYGNQVAVEAHGGRYADCVF